MSLAKKAYGGTVSESKMLMDLGSRVSRKKEFIPAVASAIQNGWNRATDLGRGLSNVDEDELGQLEVKQTDPFGQVQRICSSLTQRVPVEFLQSMRLVDDNE